MRRLVVGTFLTLDGVLQGPGGPEEDRSGGFAHGGWLVPYFDDTMGRIIAEWIRGSGGFVLGRKTYEIFAAHWPHVTNGPIAETLNTALKYVASRTLDRVTWRHATLIRGNVAEAVGRLKGEPGGELQPGGGPAGRVRAGGDPDVDHRSPAAGLPGGRDAQVRVVHAGAPDGGGDGQAGGREPGPKIRRPARRLRAAQQR
jgi:dihydrofolate reductase